VSREQPARNRWDIEIFWEIRRKVQKNEGVDCAIGGRTGTFCKDRAGHALLSDCSTNERSAFIAVPLPFRGHEDRIGGSAICDTPGMVTITPNARLGQQKSMAVAHGLAIVKPDEPFLVKLCNFGEDQVIVRWNSTLGFAEPYQGPMLFAVLDEKSPKDGVDHSSAGTSRDPLEDLDLSEASEYLHKQIRNMLKTHSSMWDGALGVIRATEHAIVTPPDALPLRAQPYRTGPSKRQIISDQINKMLKLNVIARSHSAWASPSEIVPKKNGEARFCVDYRRLNNFTKKDAYPLPRMEDCLDSLGDA